MRAPLSLFALTALAFASCDEPTTPTTGRGGLNLQVLANPAGLGQLDAGRVIVQREGATPVSRDVTPGATVTIDQLTPGSYTVALEGFVGGAVDMFGQTSGVQVVAGRNTTASVNFTTFVPVLNAAQPSPTDKTFTVTYAALPGAVSYEVEAATDAGFTQNRVVVTETQTSAQVTVPVYGRYNVRVRATDPYQGRGRPSTAQSVPVTAPLYMIRDSDDMLQRLNPVSLAVTNVGPLGVSYAFGDCAWNPANNTFYMVEGRSGPPSVNGLYRLDVTSGAATLIGVHGRTDMFAIGFHPPSNALYGVSGASDSLYRFNINTGQVTPIGPTGTTASINGLVWDSTRNQFVAISANVGGAQLFNINVATGTATLLASSPGIDNNGLTYDPVLDRFWAADYQGNVHQYNPASSYARTTVATGQGTRTCIARVP